MLCLLLTVDTAVSYTHLDVYKRQSTDSPTKNHGDYTNAGVLEWPLGIWHEPKPGVT